jgi:Fic family protein
MKWNWQQKEWPNFRYEAEAITQYELRFLQKAGEHQGVLRYVGDEDQKRLIVDILELESYKTSSIEGEQLNRDSLQSSIRRHFGLKTDHRRIPPAEQGIAEVSIDLYESFQKSLTEETLFRWHSKVAQARTDVSVGQYRTHKEPMQIVSGPIHEPVVHYEAPPSNRVPHEMQEFIRWFNEGAASSLKKPNALTRAGIAHLYFESIHPFEDGNGRIGRALSEKALSQALGRPTLIALANQIDRDRKRYYAELQKASKGLDVTDWLVYFSETVLAAQEYSLQLLDFLIQKGKLFIRYRDQLNERQEKVLRRIFDAGLEGFQGGLSVSNYISITKTSRATATRDLADLVQIGIFTKTGELKSTRYHLNLG